MDLLVGLSLLTISSSTPCWKRVTTATSTRKSRLCLVVYVHDQQRLIVHTMYVSVLVRWNCLVVVACLTRKARDNRIRWDRKPFIWLDDNAVSNRERMVPNQHHIHNNFIIRTAFGMPSQNLYCLDHDDGTMVLFFLFFWGGGQHSRSSVIVFELVISHLWVWRLSCESLCLATTVVFMI